MSEARIDRGEEVSEHVRLLALFINPYPRRSRANVVTAVDSTRFVYVSYCAPYSHGY
jgi:hypothetical protein